MSSPTPEKNLTYTQKLIEELNIEYKNADVNQKNIITSMIGSIKRFAEDQRKIINDEKEKQKGLFTWGKFKGKKIDAVFKIDQKYCEWALKSSYLREDQKEYINMLISDESHKELGRLSFSS
jgi:hypothetical protein